MTKNKVLLVGKYGKAHAMAKALVKNEGVQLYSIMEKKNPGIAELCHDFILAKMDDKQIIEQYARKVDADLVILSPAQSIVPGVADYLNEKGIPCIGPTKLCAKLESDKAFVRRILKDHGMDVAPRFRIFDNEDDAVSYVRNGLDSDFAVKPAGITVGDGVKVLGKQLRSKEEAASYIHEIFERNIGDLPYIVIEDKIDGMEFTLQAFVDGYTVKPMPAVRDYKLLLEGEQGSNTPGMGSYSDSDHLLPFVSEDIYKEGLNIIQNTIDILRTDHNEYYKGFISGQFMITDKGLQLVEFNVRPGDSEFLNIIPILQTDFFDICNAIYNSTLKDLTIEYDHKATVCKYTVSKDFPKPTGNIRAVVDRDAIEKEGAQFFYSCFEAGKDEYEPSPRGFAVTAVADTIDAATALCNDLLTNHIHGDDLYFRRDIGATESKGGLICK
ncbi:MAG: phosphoribosylamine--glycine ligase [Verrucomicrobia bacterium]|nr:phosphoribosylamine--glycine ligase [Verrucomicrobiota bacterium]MCF7708174.1 phosphoribosylamine--glycine ligase [Verrucomicrobiota bacterium]